MKKFEQKSTKIENFFKIQWKNYSFLKNFEFFEKRFLRTI